MNHFSTPGKRGYRTSELPVRQMSTYETTQACENTQGHRDLPPARLLPLDVPESAMRPGGRGEFSGKSIADA